MQLLLGLFYNISSYSAYTRTCRLIYYEPVILFSEWLRLTSIQTKIRGRKHIQHQVEKFEAKFGTLLHVTFFLYSEQTQLLLRKMLVLEKKVSSMETQLKEVST